MENIQGEETKEWIFFYQETGLVLFIIDLLGSILLACMGIILGKVYQKG